MSVTDTYAEFVAVVDGDTHWLAGTAMNPTAAAIDPLPGLPGFPFLHASSGAVIVGPTGGGRSSLIQAGLYDAARAGLRCAYLGSEVTEPEWNARAAILAQRRNDAVDDDLLTDLARARYLNLASAITQGWADPAAWVEGIVARYDLIAIDPLSAVASALDLDFDQRNSEFIRFYDRLVQPLTDRGVAVPMVDNVGHATEAKARAKGVSAKQDRADLTFSCALHTNPVGLIVKAHKVRSVRAPIARGDEWLFLRDTQEIERRDRPSGSEDTTFRPTNIMEKISKAIEQKPGLSKSAIRATTGRKAEHVDLAIELLIREGYVEVRKDGQAHPHHTVKPYRETDDPPTESTESLPSLYRVRDSASDTESHRVPHPYVVGGDSGLGSDDTEPPNQVHPNLLTGAEATV